MKLRYIIAIACLLPGCILQDDFAECLNEGHAYCASDEKTGLPISISCEDSKVNRSNCPLGCNPDTGICVSNDNLCDPQLHHTVCTSVTTQLRCELLKDQPESMKPVYIKQIVACENDGVCNPMTHKCDEKSEINESCEGKENYCDESSTTISHYCSNGIYYTHDCADEKRVCMNGRCVEEPKCDPITFKTYCEGPETIWICDEYGQPRATSCPEKMECINNTCSSKYNEGDACEETTFSNYCVEDRFYQCENGKVKVLDCTLNDNICETPKFMGYEAGCYPKCDVLSLTTSRPSCLRNDYKLSYEACVETQSKRKVLISQIVSNTCFGDSFTSCTNGNVLMMRCEGGCQVSADLGYSAHCTSLTASNCTTEDTFACKDLHTRVICDSHKLMPTEEPCAENERCSEGQCVPADAPAVAGEFCNPRMSAVCMDKNIMLQCNTTTGLYEYIDCSGFSFNYTTSSVVTAECKTFKLTDTTNGEFEAACAAPCANTTCYQQGYPLSSSCLNGKFLYLTSAKTTDGTHVNRITEVSSKCETQIKLYCSGNDMKKEMCATTCVNRTPTTAECSQ